MPISGIKSLHSQKFTRLRVALSGAFSHAALRHCVKVSIRLQSGGRFGFSESLRASQRPGTLQGLIRKISLNGAITKSDEETAWQSAQGGCAGGADA